MVVIKVVQGVRNHFFYRLPEWALTADLMVVASVLLYPGSTFNSSSSYSAMARVASENTWGVCILLVASVRLAALLLNGTFKTFARYSPLARTVCALLSALTWGSLSLSFFYGNPVGTGWANYAVWMLVDATLAIHIASEAGAAWKAKNDGPT